MKKHMTQMELTRTRRLIESGVTDIEEIQKHVFCHETMIRRVLEQYDVDIPEPPKAPEKKPPPKKKAATKKAESTVASRLAKKESGKKVDPIS